MLKNPFYYGEFEYPIGSGRWYKGSHEPIIGKDVFDMVQARRIGPRGVKYGAKAFAYQDAYLNVETAGMAVLLGEEKFKKLLDGTFTHHIYYHCSKTLDKGCGNII